MSFMAFFTRSGGSVGLLKRSKVQLPPTGGSVGPRKRAKVQAPPLRGSDGLFKPSKVHGGEARILGGGFYKVTFVLQGFL